MGILQWEWWRHKPEVFLARPLKTLWLSLWTLIFVIRSLLLAWPPLKCVWAEKHAIDGATSSLRVPSVRISLQPIIIASYARCLHILPLFAHTLSTLSVSVAVTRPLIDTALETANSLPGLCISLTLFAHTLNVVCRQSSSQLSAHQSPSTLPLAASRFQPVPPSLFPGRFLPAS